MNDKKIAIRVQGLGKKYTLGGSQEKYLTLRDTLVNSVKAPFKRFHSAPHVEGFWALKDVSFDVDKGEIVGIIGKNGAGKSTLLKILSRITSPTEGTVELHGRVGSLLEVGTGFHQEMTGRENIFLNGSILGMKKTEIEQKFDEIVRFAEIDKFIDTPVKRYSSGMYVRLAFAVAAHLEPEILIVDEVLAVGDAQFQKKCMGKMGEVAKEGRTVLFVSHNLNAISSLCSCAILLNNGFIACRGAVDDTISIYRNSLFSILTSDAKPIVSKGSGGVILKDVWLENSSGERTQKITSTESISLNLYAIIDPVYQNGKNLSVGFGIDSEYGHRLFTCVSTWKDFNIITKGKDMNVLCLLPFVPFVPGKYFINAALIYQNDTLVHSEHCGFFEIQRDDVSFYVHRTKDQGEFNIDYRFQYVS